MTIFDQLTDIVGINNILIKEEEKSYASLDQSNGLHAVMPQMVIKVASQDELIASVMLCIKYKIPLVIRAAGSGKSGGAIPVMNGIVIDITKLDHIIEINQENLWARVEPGLILHNFKEAVAKNNLFYPPDPASQYYCTLGGNVAENASGPSTLKYGSTRDYLLGGKAITGEGKIIEFGKLCPKGVVGYDMASLLCGSEGTLAVFINLTMRLLPKPKSLALGIFYFTNEFNAFLAIKKLFSSSCRPKALEYIDKTCINALKAYLHIDLPGDSCALIIECDAMYLDGAEQELYDIKALLCDLSSYYDIINDQENIHIWWHRRSQLSKACEVYLGYKISEDIALPLGKIKDWQYIINALNNNNHIIIAIFGHAGDGNLHVQIMFADKSYEQEALMLSKKILLLVVGLGGTIAAEHGIGLKKKSYLSLEQSWPLIDMQKKIKLLFDPYNLLNPGKIFDI